MERVKSSTIEVIEYESTQQILDVKFKSGSTYRYKGVPEALYEALFESDFLGSFFAKNIKNKFVTFKLVEVEGKLTEVAL